MLKNFHFIQSWFGMKPQYLRVRVTYIIYIFMLEKKIVHLVDVDLLQRPQSDIKCCHSFVIVGCHAVNESYPIHEFAYIGNYMHQ